MKNKLLLLVLVLALALPLAADVQNNFNGNAVSIINASGAPANPCTRVSTFYIDSSTGNLYLCKSAGSNWGMPGGGGGGALTPPVTISDTAANTDLSLINTTAATLGAAQSSPIFDIQGKYWNGASAADDWTIKNVLSNGLNGTSTLTIGHTGSTSQAVSIGASVSGTSFTAVAAGTHNWTGRSALFSPADGKVELLNNAGTAFTSLQFGGTSASFPELKVNGTALNLRLADDSADAPLTASTLGLSGLLTDTTGGCASIAEQYGATATVGFAQGATTAQVGLTNGTNCSILFTVSTTPAIREASGGLIAFSGTANDATASLDTGISRGGSGILDFGNGTAANTSALVQDGMKKFVTTDFTDANSASLQAITGITFALGSNALNWSFHCQLNYSQATAVAGDQFGVGVITTAPTNVNAFGNVFTSTGAASVQSTGALNGLASTTPTAVVTFQPAVNATVYGAYLDGTIETTGGGAATFNLYVLNGTAADVIIVKRGSYCTLY